MFAEGKLFLAAEKGEFFQNVCGLENISRLELFGKALRARFPFIRDKFEIGGQLRDEILTLNLGYDRANADAVCILQRDKYRRVVIQHTQRIELHRRRAYDPSFDLFNLANTLTGIRDLLPDSKRHTFFSP